MTIEKQNLPQHIAIIPDGNRRWAKAKGKKPWEGHDAGADNTEELIKTAHKIGINCMTFWGSSVNNLAKRPLDEKRALLDIYEKYFKRLIESKEIYENETRINVIGRWEEQLPESLKKIIREGVEKTKHFKKKVLNFMIAYSGTDEMVQVAQKIKDKYEKGVKITAEILKENLMTADIPAVDLLIRTGGEPHNSAGFMMWDTAESQLYFSEKMYPDFGPKEFEEAVEEYQRRERRLGK